MIPFSLTVDVGEVGADYAAYQIKANFRDEFAVTSAFPIIGAEFDRANVPFSLQIEFNPLKTTIEQIRRELLKFGWGYFKIKKAYSIPDIDPRVCEAIEWSAYDQGELPL